MTTPTLPMRTTGRASSSVAVGPLSLTTSGQAAASPDNFKTTGKEMFLIHNGGGSSITVTLQFGPTATVDGQTPSNETVTITAGDTVIIGPFPATFTQTVSSVSVVQITYSSVTSVTSMAFTPATN